MASPEKLVTGDAVVLDVQVAQLPVRALSSLIDITVMFIGYLVGLVLWAMTLSEFDPALSGAVLTIYTVLVLVGYPITFEMATRGRSLGKLALGLRVVSDDGGPERFRQAVFRALAGVVELWMFFGGPAAICSLLSPTGKRIGDVFAGTMVISERGPKLRPPPPMPPELAWWAASLELSGLRPGQAEMARQFLSRAMQLDPRVREEMAYRIAGDVVAQISPPPPPGTPPYAVLAAVLAERHRRELARLRPDVAGPPAPWPDVAGPPAPWPDVAGPPAPWPDVAGPPALRPDAAGPPAPWLTVSSGPPPPAPTQQWAPQPSTHTEPPASYPGGGFVPPG